GIVTFSVFDANDNLIGTPVTTSVSNGQASATYTLPGATPLGTYTIQAVYDDRSIGNYQNSTGTGTLTIVSAATTTSVSNVTASFSPAAQNVTLSASVTSSDLQPVNEGTVTFSVFDANGNLIGTPVTASVLNGQASATYTLPAGTPAGTYTIQAVYDDSRIGNYQGS